MFGALAGAGLRALALVSIGVSLVALLGALPEALSTPLGQFVPWPLLSCVAPLLLVGVWPPALREVVAASSRGPLVPTATRMACGLAFVATATAAVALAAPSDATPVAGDGLVAWRNAALTAGLVLLGTLLLAPSLAWLPAVGFALANAAGGVALDDRPRDWALLAADAGDRRALAIALGLGLLGVSLLLLAAGRPPARSSAPGRQRQQGSPSPIAGGGLEPPTSRL